MAALFKQESSKLGLKLPRKSPC